MYFCDVAIVDLRCWDVFFGILHMVIQYVSSTNFYAAWSDFLGVAMSFFARIGHVHTFDVLQLLIWRDCFQPDV